MQSKINKDADKTSGVGNTIATDEEEKTVQKQSDEFYLQINMAKNVMVVYRYDADKKNKTAYKIFPCTLGENVKKGKYKILLYSPCLLSYLMIHIMLKFHCTQYCVD